SHGRRSRAWSSPRGSPRRGRGGRGRSRRRRRGGGGRSSPAGRGPAAPTRRRRRGRRRYGVGSWTGGVVVAVGTRRAVSIRRWREWPGETGEGAGGSHHQVQAGSTSFPAAQGSAEGHAGAEDDVGVGRGLAGADERGDAVLAAEPLEPLVR